MIIKRSLYIIVMVLLFARCKGKGKMANDMAPMVAMKMDSVAIDSALLEVVNRVNQIVISDQETVRPGIRKNESGSSADGYIVIDERRNNKVSARFGGRVEKLYMKYNYKYVKKGEKIMELYSPEINTIEEEYIHHLKSISDSHLIQKTREKLQLLGISNEQIGVIEKTRQPLESITLYCPYEGYIILNTAKPEMKTQLKTLSPYNAMGMGAGPGSSASANESRGELKEGSYLLEGQTLFIVNDFKEVWAIVPLDPKSEAKIHLYAAVIVTSAPANAPFKAIINFIEPYYREDQKFTQARIYLKNEQEQYKINSLVTVEFTQSQEMMSVPNSAVLDLGKRKIVWVKKGMTKEGNKMFEARTVTSGFELNGYTQIINGISEQDEIARDAGYMIDNGSLIETE